jgi:hypothetical protein
MRHLLLALSLAFLPVVAAEAKDPKPPAANGEKVRDYPVADLAGKWVEDGGRLTQIKVSKGKISVTKIVDGDGEKFVLRQQGIRNGHFMFTYFVPSTEYVVTYEVTSIAGDTAQVAWTNDHDASGTDEMTK